VVSRLSVALAALLFVAGCGEANKKGEFAIYDWEAQRSTSDAGGVTKLDCAPNGCPNPDADHVYVRGRAKLTSGHLDREMIRADVEPQVGRPVLLLFFTPVGNERFEELTRMLARRGGTNDLHRFLVVIDDKVYSSAGIDSRVYPEGLSAENGMQIDLPSIAEARELARALRGD
jgi:preprotein translocase subunit SecD